MKTNVPTQQTGSP
jgi:hypothetical protein